MKTISAMIALCGFALLGGCEAKPAEGTAPANNASETSMASNSSNTAASNATAPPPATQTPTSFVDPTSQKPKDGDEVAVMETNLGQIVLMFFPDKAPKHVENFKKLSKDKFYDGTKFHRVIPGFMIQGGDPNSKDNDRSNDGLGGPETSVDAEFNDIDHVRGVLSMARSQDPNSAGSQFFIVVKHSDFLNGQYSAFGQVVKGIEVADKIVALERDAQDNPLESNPAIIKSVRIAKWPVK